MEYKIVTQLLSLLNEDRITHPVGRISVFILLNIVNGFWNASSKTNLKNNELCPISYTYSLVALKWRQKTTHNMPWITSYTSENICSFLIYLDFSHISNVYANITSRLSP